MRVKVQYMADGADSEDDDVDWTTSRAVDIPWATGITLWDLAKQAAIKLNLEALWKDYAWEPCVPYYDMDLYEPLINPTSVQFQLHRMANSPKKPLIPLTVEFAEGTTKMALEASLQDSIDTSAAIGDLNDLVELTAKQMGYSALGKPITVIPETARTWRQVQKVVVGSGFVGSRDENPNTREFSDDNPDSSWLEYHNPNAEIMRNQIVDTLHCRLLRLELRVKGRLKL